MCVCGGGGMCVCVCVSECDKMGRLKSGKCLTCCRNGNLLLWKDDVEETAAAASDKIAKMNIEE